MYNVLMYLYIHPTNLFSLATNLLQIHNIYVDFDILWKFILITDDMHYNSSLFHIFALANFKIYVFCISLRVDVGWCASFYHCKWYGFFLVALCVFKFRVFYSILSYALIYVTFNGKTMLFSSLIQIFTLGAYIAVNVIIIIITWTTLNW